MLLALLLPWSAMATAGTLWTPGSPGAPALDLWFDAADASSLSRNPGNTNQVLGWHDKSGNNRDATADASYAPSVTTLNGKTALDFGPFVFSTSNPHMFFPVVRAGTVFKVWGSAGGGSFFMTNRFNYAWHRSVRLADETNPSNAIFDVDHNYSEDAVRTGDAFTRLNGAGVDPSTAGLSGDWDVVMNSAATGNLFDTDTLAEDRTYRTGGEGMAEVIVVSGRMSDYDVQRVEGYLAWKWGLQGKLPPGHPYKSQAPMVDNLFANGGFEAGTLGDGNFNYRPTDQGPWVFNGDVGDATYNSPISGQGTPPPPEGRISAFVQIHGYIEQTFNVNTAGAYTLSFQIAQRQYLDRQTLSILVDGSQVLSVQAPGDVSWQAVTTPSFTLSVGSHTIRFAGTANGDATAFVDDLVLSANTPPVPASLLAELHLDEAGWNGTPGEAVDSSGNGHPGSAAGGPMPLSANNVPARPAVPGSCSYASMSGGAFNVDGLPVSTVAGDKTSVSFWMYWDGTTDAIPISWQKFDLWLNGGAFGFNTGQSDIFGISSNGLANGWHHVAAVFVNNSIAGELYIDGVSQSLSTQMGTPLLSNAVVGGPLRIGNFISDGAHPFRGFVDEVRIYNGAITVAQVTAAMNAGHACPVAGVTGGFNAFESATTAGAITGVIHTKVAGTAFSVDVVALDAPRSAVLSSFTGAVRVEILDASNNSGTLDADGCNSSWVTVASGTAASLTFTGADTGRKTVTLTEPEAWRDVRLRISTPATGTPTAQACSNDNFAIRPAAFAALSASDADSASAGTMRSMANTGGSGGVVHKAGQPFTVQAKAVNGSGTTTANYTGTPTAVASVCTGAACVPTWTTVASEGGSFSVTGTQTVRYGADTRWSTLVVSGNVGCGNTMFGDPAYGVGKVCQVAGLLGSLSLVPSAAAGVISRSGTYSEVGAFSLQLVDSSFAGVDAHDGSSSTEMNIVSSTLAVGRFVPDHFEVVPLAAPMLKTFDDNTCGARSFTYVGQPFGFVNVPQARVLARNAAGATTAGYADALWKLDATGLAQAFTPTPAAPALDSSAATLPTVTANGDGSGLLVGAGTNKLRFDRSSAVPLAPFNASIALSWSAQDGSEAAVAGNGTITTPAPLVFANIAFDAGNQMRFGVLRLMPAYGSELLNLPVLIEAQYWDGQRMATNSADQCTAVPSSSVVMGNYQRNLAACKTALGTASTSLAGGRGFLRLVKPGNGNSGSVDLTLQLGASATGLTCAAVNGPNAATTPANLGWLQGRWGNASAFTQNPSTRASFGQYRSPFIFQREMF